MLARLCKVGATARRLGRGVAAPSFARGKVVARDGDKGEWGESNISPCVEPLIVNWDLVRVSVVLIDRRTFVSEADTVARLPGRSSPERVRLARWYFGLGSRYDADDGSSRISG